MGFARPVFSPGHPTAAGAQIIKHNPTSHRSLKSAILPCMKTPSHRRLKTTTTNRTGSKSNIGIGRRVIFVVGSIYSLWSKLDKSMYACIVCKSWEVKFGPSNYICKETSRLVKPHALLYASTVYIVSHLEREIHFPRLRGRVECLFRTQCIGLLIPI